MRYSSVVVGNPVPFPLFMYERIYMREFLDGQLPDDLKRWQPTVDAMMNGRTGKAFLMVDQAVVHQGMVHRRPGLHVDGVWNPAVFAHGHGGHLSAPAGRHGQHRHGHVNFGSQTLLLASDNIGCTAYEGWWDGDAGPGGDCSHIDVGNMAQVVMAPGACYMGDALSMVHESLPQMKWGPRTVVRINVED